MYKIALDAMGLDKGPETAVKGAIYAIEQSSSPITVYLTGKEEILKPLIKKYDNPENIKIINANEIIEMGESPSEALTKKPDSSLNTCILLQKNKEVDASICPGNTGASMASALLNLGRLQGVTRPSIAVTFPSRSGKVIFIDGGANSDCKPHHLLEFAVMGKVFAKIFLKIQNPKIALLNIGEEETKGNKLAKSAYKLLNNESNLEFIGNIEGKDFFNGDADVIVTDGFTGNIILKFFEGSFSFIMEIVKENIDKSQNNNTNLFPINQIKKVFDYSEYGGMPLLGINGIVTICHGRSNDMAIKNAILFSAKYIENNITENLKEEIRKLNIIETEDIENK